MKIDDLKREAREHERKEDWIRALGLYRRAAEALDEAEEPDMSLLNRMADIHIRLGEVERAVERYDEAVDLYLESGLENNAVAVCRKVIRNIPQRPETWLRLGRIRADQGFEVDARGHFLTYAQMEHEAGRPEAAVEALEELVTRYPADPVARRALAEGYVGLERSEDAIRELLSGRRLLHAAGVDADIAEIEERLLELDPELELPDPDEPLASADGAEPSPPEEADSGDDDLFGLAFDDPFSEGEAVADWPDDASAGDQDEEDRAPGAGDVPDEPGEEVDPSPMGLSFEDPFGLGQDTESDGGPPAEGEPAVAGLETTGLDEVHDDVEAGLESGSDRLDEGDAQEPFDPDLAFDLEGEEVDDAPEEAAPLPLLSDSPEAAETLGPLVSPVEDDRSDAVARAREDVEVAVRTGDASALVSALGDLARALDDAGDYRHAESVRERISELSSAEEGMPGEEEVTETDASPLLPPAATGGVVGSSAGEEPPAPPESGEGWVDLGSLVLDGPGEGGTRWTVEADEPSGDEDADFTRMLASFKDKVADNLSRDDARAQYDLGAAYREMGLWDEAIAQFQQALRADPRHLGSYEMMGRCFLEKGEPRIAVRVLERALGLSWEIEDDLVGIHYFMGLAHEASGQVENARDCFEKVFALDINFMDVTDRLRELR